MVADPRTLQIPQWRAEACATETRNSTVLTPIQAGRVLTAVHTTWQRAHRQSADMIDSATRQK